MLQFCEKTTRAHNASHVIRTNRYLRFLKQLPQCGIVRISHWLLAGVGRFPPEKLAKIDSSTTELSQDIIGS